MKLSSNSIGMLIFIALATVIFVLMMLRPTVEGNAMNLGVPINTEMATTETTPATTETETTSETPPPVEESSTTSSEKEATTEAETSSEETSTESSTTN